MKSEQKKRYQQLPTNSDADMKNTDDIELKEESKHSLIERQTFHQNKESETWLNIRVDLTEIDTKSQTFSIYAFVNIFWIDAAFVDGVFNEKCASNNKHIHSMSHDEFKNVFGSYRLPVNVTKLFENAVSTDIPAKDEWKIWINPQTKDLHIFLKWKGRLTEHLECEDFPFDAQYLNIKILLDTKHYNFVTKCPDFVYLASPFKYHLPITCTKFSSIVQWKMLSPWMDLRNKKKYFRKQNNLKKQGPEFDYSLIKLRVQRKPYFYLLYTALPLTLIITSSFAVVSIPPDEIGDRLGFLVTLMLTIAAFQYAISTDLPESPTLTNVDKFILSGYGIACLFIIYVSISVKFTEYEESDMIELVLPFILCVLWICCIVTFICCPFCKYKRGVDWIKMWDGEFREFDVQNVLSMQENDIFLGTNSSGGRICDEKEDLYCKYTDAWMNGKRYLQIERVQHKTDYDLLCNEWKEYEKCQDKSKY
eukprot:225333_1